MPNYLLFTQEMAAPCPTNPSQFIFLNNIQQYWKQPKNNKLNSQFVYFTWGSEFLHKTSRV